MVGSWCATAGHLPTVCRGDASELPESFAARCKEMREMVPAGAAQFPRQVQEILQAALELRNRRDQDQISEHGLAVARGRLEIQMDDPMVVTRKFWGGNRTPRGAHTQSVLGSVLQTCRQQKQPPIPVMAATVVFARANGAGPHPLPWASTFNLKSFVTTLRHPLVALVCEGAKQILTIVPLLASLCSSQTSKDSPSSPEVRIEYARRKKSHKTN